MKKHTQEEAELLFRKKGFKLLDTYVSNCHNQKVKCLKCKHVTYTSLSSRKCSFCNPNNSEKKLLTCNYFKKKCKEAGVRFLCYKNANEKRWQCPKCKSIFKTWPTRCSTCLHKNKIKESYEKLKNACTENNDELLTKFSEYHTIQQKVKIRYKCGHVGTPQGNNYLTNPKCNICARKKVGKHKRIDIKYIKRNCKYANIRIVSKFISTSGNGYYKGICNKCGCEVKIKSSSYKIPRCPKCNPFTIQEPLVETLLREWLVKKTKKEWIKTRPSWLPSPSCKGYFLELDMYCEDLKLAIEYQGPHHYLDNVGIFGLNEKQVLKIVKHDKVKKEICNKRRIKLLVINGTKYDTFKSARKLVKKWLIKEGIL